MEKFIAKMNGIVIYTCFNNKSYFGYKSNALKSGICKYYRRNESDKFLWCVVEMMLFKFHENGKGLMTNLLNRLRILLMEDMSCSEVDRTLLGIQKLEEFEKCDRKDYYKIFEFCQIVIEGKRGRSISYVNCWWRNHPDKLDLSQITVKEVLKYQKKGDNDEILKLGEKLIEYLKCNDEKILDILMKMIKFEKVGKRYRRYEGLYLFMEIVRDFCDNEKLIKLWDFAMEMLSRKKMKERYHFGVWFGTIMWKRNEIDFGKDMGTFDKKTSINGVLSNFIERDFLELDDYVLKDWHVSKKYTLEKFSKVGAFVEDEDMELLSESKFNIYKKCYMDMKVDKKPKGKKVEEEKTEEKPREKKPRKEVRNDKWKKIKKMRGKSNFDDLETKLSQELNPTQPIRLCTETTCGNKVMCFELNGQIWKECRKSLNYNRDYCVVDGCKELFGLNKIGMTRVLSNFRIVKIDKGTKEWSNNWKKETIIDGEQLVVYCVMDRIEPGIEVGKMKRDVLGCRKLLKEFIKIGVFRGIFRVSDFNGRNVLLKGKDELVSIDEGDIGKRLEILGKREKWLVVALNKDKAIINEIIAELNSDWNEKSELVKDIMRKYMFSEELFEEVCKNWENLANDLKLEGVEFE